MTDYRSCDLRCLGFRREKYILYTFALVFNNYSETKMATE